jgi:hypothetical protein
VAILALSRSRHRLVIVFHHIIIDGPSLEILLQEWQQTYRSLSSDCGTLSLPPTAMQYADYSRRQRARLETGHGNAAVAYWRRQLSELVVVRLPADLTPTDGGPSRGAHLSRRLSEPLTARLRLACHAHRVSPFMVFAAAIFVLIHRVTGRRDLVIGCPVSGRTDVGLQRTIGPFVHPLPIRVRLSPSWTPRDLLDAVRRTVLEAYAHHDVPLERIARECAPGRLRDRAPLFPVWLVVQHGRIATTTAWADGIEMSPIAFRFNPARLDVAFVVVDDGPTLQMSVTYDTARFTARRAGEWADAAVAVLDEIVCGGDAAIVSPVHAEACDASTEFIF